MLAPMLRFVSTFTIFLPGKNDYVTQAAGDLFLCCFHSVDMINDNPFAQTWIFSVGAV